MATTRTKTAMDERYDRWRCLWCAAMGVTTDLELPSGSLGAVGASCRLWCTVCEQRLGERLCGSGSYFVLLRPPQPLSRPGELLGERD